jgi:hypothetical protein
MRRFILAIALLAAATAAHAQDPNEPPPNVTALLDMLHASVNREGDALSNAIMWQRKAVVLGAQLDAAKKELDAAKKPPAPAQ